MRRKQSTLFAPYRAMGVVSSAIRPVFRICSYSKQNSTSLLMAIDNTVYHYNAATLRTIAVSDTLPDMITAIAADNRYTYAAAGTLVYCMPLCRDVTRTIDIKSTAKFMTIFGDYLIIVDDKDGLRVFDCETGEPTIHLEGSSQFKITSILHPSTYLNKILLGSENGSLRLVNVRTGKIVHEFTKRFPSAVVVAVQTPAIDVIAFGLADGNILVHNIRVDETVCSFRHDCKITAIGFRTDGEPTMTTADEIGHIAVWDLEKQELIGKITKFHTASLTYLHFFHGEPIMGSSSHYVSTSADNSIIKWVLDGADGMPRMLSSLEGHAQPVSAVKFCSKDQVLSSGFDGSVRKYSVTNPTMRQKLGSAGIMSRTTAKKKKRDFESIKLEPVIDIAMGWSREASWDNVLCRHRDSLLVTTWTSRKNSQGTHNIAHDRFLKGKDFRQFRNAVATSTCISSCGNFAFVGYSIGHVDQFNVQSGRFLKTFEDSELVKKLTAETPSITPTKKAHSAAVTALSVDAHGHELVSASADGEVRFWQIRTGKCAAVIRTSNSITLSSQSPTSSLVAFACRSADGEGASVVVIDTLCRRVVRNFKSVGKSVRCVTFSSDGRWILTADDVYMRVWELSTSKLIDVMLFDKPCIGMSFNVSGQYLATVHEDEKAIHIWANKTLFAAHVSIRALPLDYVPTWDEPTTNLMVSTCDIDSDSDSDMDDDSDAKKLDSSLVTYSGLAPSRWANLSDIALIKERNKPIEPPKKPKLAPFFLSGVSTLDGFEFDIPSLEQETDKRKTLQAKRNLLELESSFSTTLRNATTPAALIHVFGLLKKMSVSAIDFQIRSLPVSALPAFFRMLLEVIRERIDFELAQAYMAAAIKIHRAVLWTGEAEDELCSVFEELSVEEENAWDAFDSVITDNAAVVQWVKNALL